MDISLRLPMNHAGEQPGERTAEVDEFLTALTKEQTVFLAAIADAGARLDSDSGQVAQVASLQRRLTQQFLDAQRSIIKRRANTDAAVAHIAKVTDVEAGELIAAARTQAAGMGMAVEDLWAAYLSRAIIPTAAHPGAEDATDASAERGAAPTGADVSSPWPAPRGLLRAPVGRGPGADLPAPDTREMVRHQITELGVRMIRTGAEAQSLAGVIDEAFTPVEPDGAAARRQLRDLLDEWWRAENQEHQEAIDDANARAAMRLHVARIEATAILEASRVEHGDAEQPIQRCMPPSFLPPPAAEDPVSTLPPPDPQATPQPNLHPNRQTTGRTDVLPQRMAAVLDSAADVGLDAVLASLLDSLDTAPEQASVSDDVDRTADIDAELEPARDVGSVALDGARPQEAFERFWGSVVTRRTGQPTREWMLIQVVLPAVAVIAVMALVLAVVG